MFSPPPEKASVDGVTLETPSARLPRAAGASPEPRTPTACLAPTRRALAGARGSHPGFPGCSPAALVGTVLPPQRPGAPKWLRLSMDAFCPRPRIRRWKASKNRLFTITQGMKKLIKAAAPPPAPWFDI